MDPLTTFVAFTACAVIKNLSSEGSLSGFLGKILSDAAVETIKKPVAFVMETIGLWPLEKLRAHTNGDLVRLVVASFSKAIAAVRGRKSREYHNRKHIRESIVTTLEDFDVIFQILLKEYEEVEERAAGVPRPKPQVTHLNVVAALMTSLTSGEVTSVSDVILAIFGPPLRKELKACRQQPLSLADEICAELAQEFFIQLQHLYKTPKHEKGRLALERDIAWATIQGIDRLEKLDRDQLDEIAELRRRLEEIADGIVDPPDWTPNFNLVLAHIRDSEDRLSLQVDEVGAKILERIDEQTDLWEPARSDQGISSPEQQKAYARQWRRQRERLLDPKNSESPAHYLTPKKVARTEIIDDYLAAGSIKLRARHVLFTAPACFGKTVMMSVVRERYPELIAAAYFVRPACSDSRQLGLFVQTIAAQLERLVGDFHKGLQADLADSVLLAPEGPVDSEQAGAIFERVLAAVNQSVFEQSEAQVCYMLIDGIDELGPAGIRIKRLLLDETRWNELPCLRIIASAQPSEEVEFEAEEGWQVVRLNEDKDARRRQHAAMQEYAESELAPRIVDVATRSELAAALGDHVQGNFLLLHHLLNDSARHLPQGGLTRDWIAAQPKAPDAYLRRRFEGDWFQTGGEPDERGILPAEYFRHAQRLLSLLLSQRTPTSIERLGRAAVDKSDDLGITFEVLRRMRSCIAYRGHPSDRHCRVLFDHDSSMRSWLTEGDSDGRGVPRANVGFFRQQVGLAQGHALWSDYAVGLTTGPATDAKIEFLAAYGVYHACRAAQIAAQRSDHAGSASAVSPLSAPSITINWLYTHLESEQFEHLARAKSRLPRLNRWFFSTVSVCDEHPDSITMLSGGLPVEAFVSLLTRALGRGANEIPALAPPLRVLARMGFTEPNRSMRERVKTAVGTIMTLVRSDQLLLRYAIARALADAYWGRKDKTFRRFLITVVRGLRKLGRKEYDAAEAAAYCSKFLWSRGLPAEDLYVAYAHRTHGKELAESDHYNMRMAYGESLIERACDPENRLDSNQLERAAPWNASFWTPIWPYHRTDLAEAVGVFEFRMTNGGQDFHWEGNGASASSQDSACASFRARETTLVNVVFNRLGDAAGGISRLIGDPLVPNEFKSAARSYWQTERVLVALERCGKSLRFLSSDAIFECLWPFVLHPVWEVTEAAASLLSELRDIRIKDATDVINRLASAQCYWQSQYAALDAAYNSHGSDSGKIADSLFSKLVRAHVGSDHRRVQFIAAEDVLLWFRELVEAHEDVRYESAPQSL
jgi:hypothetical protein